MPDYARIVDHVQAVVYSLNPIDPSVASRVAAAYASACEEVNARLSQCSHLLNRGLRSEAIQLAETEPNLLDAVATLDFPEHAHWCEILSEAGWPGPPALFIDAAIALNEAYSAEQPLRMLLRRHRLLALARSPLRMRIDTLRAIAGLDPQNAIWRGDLGTYEEARLRELDEEGLVARDRQDVARLAALVDEIRGEWTEPPASSLVSRVGNWHREAAAQQARREMEPIGRSLNAAFAALDAETGRALRNEWCARAQIADVHRNDALYVQVAAALEWLAGEDEREERQLRYGHDLAEFESALDENLPVEELSRIYYRLTAYDEPVPELVARRYSERVAAHQLRQQRRTRLLLVGAVGGVVLTGGLVYWVIQYQKFRGEVIGAANTLAALVTENRTDEARRFLDRLEGEQPRVAAAAEVQYHAERLRAAQTAEAARVARFEATLSHAQTRLKVGQTNADIGVLQEARRLGEEAATVATTDVERAQAAHLQRDVTTAITGLAQQQETSFRERLTEVVRNVARVQESLSADVLSADMDEQLATIAADLQALTARAPLVSTALAAQLKPLEVRLAGMTRSVERLRLENRLLGKITAAVGQCDRYVAALDEYRQQLPRTHASIHFEEAAQERAAWEALLAWSELYADPVLRQVEALTSGEASKLLTRVNDLQTRHSGCALAGEVEPYMPHVAAIIARAGADGSTPLRDKVAAICTDPLVASLWMVTTLKEQRYYGRSAPREEKAIGRIRFQYLVTSERQREELFRAEEVARFGPAPQSELAKKLGELLPDWDDRRFEATMWQALKMVESSETLDPVLKLLMMRQLVAIAGEGSYSLSVALAEHHRVLQDPPVDISVNWFVPNDDASTASRPQAAQVLRGLPPLDSRAKLAAEERRKLQQITHVRYAWVGWLARSRAGDWICQLSPGENRSGELFVVLPNGEQATVERVGRVVGSTATCDVSQGAALLEGRPLFLAINENSG
jgi:hypothetical protein